jgi:hypothetical protein
MPQQISHREELRGERGDRREAVPNFRSPAVVEIVRAEIRCAG